MLLFRINAPGVYFSVRSNVLALIQAWGLIAVCIKLPKVTTNSGLQNGLYTYHGVALFLQNKTRFPFQYLSGI